MILLVIAAAIWLLCVVLQQMVLKRQAWWKKILSLALSLAMFGLLLPVFLKWKRTEMVPLDEGRVGVVFWDRSASVAHDEDRLASFVERVGSRAQLNVIEFSEQCLPPLGKGRAQMGTDFFGSLVEAKEHLQEWQPDWVWLVSDMGFDVPSTLQHTLPEDLLEVLDESSLFMSALPSLSKSGYDVSIDGLQTDPVWYARSENPVSIELSRNAVDGASEVDVLISINGALASTVRAVFEGSALKARVETNLRAEHLGPMPLELRIAEGQGGSIKENDQFLMTCPVLRDRVRVLRVVGRPNWSSKFIRDQLVQREDVDLVDFHILRAMQDRVMASSEDLALIPFPVEELFVDNIDSFDLIIWQNFDYESYPFFKPQYVRNIQAAVRSGCGMLLLNGTLPWSFDREPWLSMAPMRSKGREPQRLKGAWRVDPSHFIQGRLARDLEQAPEFSLQAFVGALHPQAQNVLSVDDQVVLASLEVGRGRVLQWASDEIWRWGFAPPTGHQRVYGDLLKRCLLWLQHHPDMDRRDVICPDEMMAGSEIELLLSEVAKDESRIVWSSPRLKNDIELSVKAGEQKLKTKAPQEPGMYQLSLNGQSPKVVLVKGLQGEMRSPSDLKEQWQKMERLGFQALDIESGSPEAVENVSLVRSNGEPWYLSPWYLLAFTVLLLAHWLLFNRSLGLHATGSNA